METDGERVEVRRSAWRTRTVSAHREAGRIVVLVPQRLSAAEEERWVRDMVAKLQAKERRRNAPGGDAELMARALELQERYLAPQLASLVRPRSVTWVTNQARRWGSCTPATATIRLSHRLRPLPAWVVDYVLLHELAHLAESAHSRRFWRLLEAYPRAQEARGYLAGWSDAQAAGEPASAREQDPLC